MDHRLRRAALPAALGVLCALGVARSYDPNSSDLNLGDVIMSSQMPGNQIILWLDADAGVYTDTTFTSPATNNTTVGGWRDQGPIGNDVTQSTGGSRPTFLSNQLNGHPVVKFTGDGHSTGQGLQTTLTGITGDLGWWIICVISDGTITWTARGADNTNFYEILTWDGNEASSSGAAFVPYGGNTNTSPSNSGGNNSWILGSGFGNSIRPQCSANFSPPTSNTYHVVTGIVGAFSTIRWDGVDKSPNMRVGASGTQMAGGTGVIDVGFSNTGFGSRYYNGNLATLILCVGQPNLTQIHRIEKFLGAKYGLTVS